MSNEEATPTSAEQAVAELPTSAFASALYDLQDWVEAMNKRPEDERRAIGKEVRDDEDNLLEAMCGFALMFPLMQCEACGRFNVDEGEHFVEGWEAGRLVKSCRHCSPQVDEPFDWSPL